MSISVNDMANLAKSLVDADAAIDAAEDALRNAKEHARILREETIPSAMQELGIESLTLDTGQKMKIQQEVYASIPSGNKNAAFQWLNDNGFGGLIKVEVITAYGKGEQTDAMQLVAELQHRGLEASFDQSVHAQTLKAFIKEQLSIGTNVPLDLFGARPVWAAKISKK